jgi:hypothetical protein
MKRCPECNRTYPDETLAFCLIDGAILSAPYDPPATTQASSLPFSDSPPTEIIPAHLLPAQPVKRSSRQRYAAALTLLLFVVGVSALLLNLRRGSSTESAKAASSIQEPKQAKLSPTEVFIAFYEAAKRKDVAAIKELVSKSTLTTLEDEAKSKNISLDNFLAEQSQLGLPTTLPETRNEKIDGDIATLEFKREGAASWSKATFAKEGGDWKLNFK